MRHQDIQAALRAANPVEPTAIRGELLADAERELIAAIVAEPREQEAPAAVPVRRRPLAVRTASLGLPFAVGAAAALVLTLLALGPGHGPAGAPEPALAAELARIAKASPIVVVNRPSRPSVRAPSPHVPGAAVRMWDCSTLPCRHRSLADAVKAGLLPRDFDASRMPRGVQLVVVGPDGPPQVSGHHPLIRIP